MRQVLLLAAHGSSTDALARDRVREHAERVALLVPHDDVRVGFARGSPSLADAVRDLAHGAPHDTSPNTHEHTTLTVVPFMTSAGYYCERVMPALLHDVLGASRTRLLITQPIGASRRITSVLQRRALRVAALHGWQPADTAVLIAGHGTTRHPASRDTAFAHARSLAMRGWGAVHAAFIDDEPGIAQVAEGLAHAHVIVLPFLVGGAAHAAIDVPLALGMPPDEGEDARLVTRNGRSFALDAPLGVDHALSDIAATLAIRMWTRANVRPRTSLSREASRAVRGDAGRDDERNNGRDAAPRVRLHTVQLVGAGPGAADLITVRGQRLLQRADVVVHDRLVSSETLALARPDALLVDVGKLPHTPQSSQTAINEQLIAFARQGKRVVRLKGGDPFVFGRGSEEVDALDDAQLRSAVVPGVSSALAGPAAAGIAVTARHRSRGFAVVTAATATDDDDSVAHVRDYARIDTLVVLMGRSRLATVCAQLIAAGRSADTPVACIERATLPAQRVVYGTLVTIADRAHDAGLESPMVTVIGPTAHDGTTHATAVAMAGDAGAIAATAAAAR